MANGGSLKGVKVIGFKKVIEHWRTFNEGAWWERLEGTSCRTHSWQPWHEPLGGHLLHTGILIFSILLHTGILNFSIAALFIIRAVWPSFGRVVATVSGMDTMGGSVMVAAFSNGTQSSKLDLRMFQHWWSFNACTTEKVAECRLVLNLPRIHLSL